jgi:hydrogenase maturation protease
LHGVCNPSGAVVSETKIILGIGNLLKRDEGVGIHALRALDPKLCTDCELVDGGTLGLDLLPIVERASHLLVFDAIDAGREAGPLIEVTAEQIPLFSTIKLSPHQLSFHEVLGLAKVRGHFPLQLILLGIQPSSMEPGIKLSHSVSGALPQLVERAEKIVYEWNRSNAKEAFTVAGDAAEKCEPSLARMESADSFRNENGRRDR